MKILHQSNLTTLAMIVIFSGAILMALALPPKAAAMPLVVGIPGLLMCLAQLVIDIVRNKPAVAVEEADPEDVEFEAGLPEKVMFIWLGLFTVAILGFGFMVGGPIIVTFFVGYNYRESARHALIAGGGTLAILYGIFSFLLELQLFDGLILGPFLN